jgi:ribonuclease T1
MSGQIQFFILHNMRKETLLSILLFIVSCFVTIACRNATKEATNNTAETTMPANAGAASDYSEAPAGESKTRKKNKKGVRNEAIPPNLEQSGVIPAKAIRVLQYVRANGEAMDGYVGGRRFGNYENRLPKKDGKNRRIDYQEWDVNPKKQGRNRGAERLVTGSDGRAWYTDDHYNTFVEIK